MGRKTRGQLGGAAGGVQERKQRGHLLLVLAEGLQDVGLPGVVPVGVLEALQQALLQDQDGDPQLMPQQLHRPGPPEGNTFNSTTCMQFDSGRRVQSRLALITPTSRRFRAPPLKAPATAPPPPRHSVQ
ncbi:hypothetical protein EYF80_030423 [Liparis tanakae]|uniref:Uncharacterized protein n=1 Tax=Liparis tanakae TaxID=230148 RepID=A0A4Z2H0P4_9TELE|nr:hypothetical protein EYF80_030423 [Liparis tanakae]